MGLLQPLGGQRGVPVGDEKGLADGVEGRLDGIRGVRHALAHPAENLLEVARAPRDSLGEKGRDGKRRRGPMGALEERRAGRIR